VHVSTGALPANRFPGQWFWSESSLHQNWMRDYDPTTGRYLQADPLGLVDGASVYGYVGQNPGRLTDPRGEFGVVGALLGGGSNLVFQMVLNYYYYQDFRKAWECIDWWDTYVATVWGALGLGPYSLIKTGQARHIPVSSALSKLSQRIYDCDCEVPEDRKLLPAIDELIRGFFL
jgi:RHS repeat-associated protein